MFIPFSVKILILKSLCKRLLFLATVIFLQPFNSSANGVFYADSSVKNFIGIWRAEFTIQNKIQVPFNFEIVSLKGALQAYLINATERFPTGDIRITNDSIFITLALFDNELAFKIQKDNLNGILRRLDQKGKGIPVIAEKGLNYRFEENASSALRDISGSYDVVFQGANGNQEKAVGIFNQKGNKLTASFLKITGDTRYLEGIIEDNTIKLSSFIGSNPVLYTAKVNSDGILQGEYINSRNAISFIATPNANAALPDAYTLTKLTNSEEKFNFEFNDINGKKVSSSDIKFRGKPLIIAIGGTWCPNCMDEAAFLGPWYKANRNRDIEIIGLQFEFQTDSQHIKKVFNRFQKQFGIEYTLLVGGIADKQEVLKSLPSLANFLSFPTTIFVDRNGQIHKIHTGFTGPATGKNYTNFIKEFNEEVDYLINH